MFMNIIRTGLIAALFSLPLASAAATLIYLDADEDGSVSYAEISEMMTDLSEDTFAEADLDDNGTLDEDELLAAEEAGLIIIPATE